MAKIPVKDVAKSSAVGPEKERQIVSFEKLLEDKLATWVPTRKGKSKSPESIAVEANFESIHLAVQKGLPYAEIAALLSLATGLEINGGKVANQYRALGVQKGVLEAPKPRKKAAAATPPATPTT